jgi:hypothetical protein
MSTPDSAHSVALLPAVPRLSQVRDAVAGLPVTVVAAAGLIAMQTAAFFSGRVLSVSMNYNFYIDSTETARVLGAVSFMSIVVIAAAIALGHRALRGTSGLARQVAGIAFGAGSVHLVLWLARVVGAAIAATSAGSSSAFLPSIFWWG